MPLLFLLDQATLKLKVPPFAPHPSTAQNVLMACRAFDATAQRRQAVAPVNDFEPVSYTQPLEAVLISGMGFRSGKGSGWYRGCIMLHSPAREMQQRAIQAWFCSERHGRLHRNAAFGRSQRAIFEPGKQEFALTALLPKKLQHPWPGRACQAPRVASVHGSGMGMAHNKRRGL